MLLKSVIFVLTLALVAIVAYGFPVAYIMYRNSTLTDSVPVEHIDWTLQKIHDEEWRPVAHYSYYVGGDLFKKEEQFQGEKFRNPFVGQDALETLAETYTRVWFAPRLPENGTLEKYFPQKRAIYALILLCIYGYVVWGIRWYAESVLSKFNTKDS